MAEQDGQEKTEQASGKKLEDARQEGKVAKSQELNSFAIFSIGLIVLYISQSFISSQFSSMSTFVFSSLDSLDLNSGLIQGYFFDGAIFFFITLAPLVLALIAAAFAVSIAQVGFRVTPKSIMPKFDKFNIVSGVKRIFFSTSSLVELLKSLIKVGIIGLFIYAVIMDYVEDALFTMELNVVQITEKMIDSGFNFVWQVAMGYALIAAADFIYQKWKYKNDQKMTKQEVKEENKQMEGDPHVKGKIKGIQFAMAKQRMMKDIPSADVVITNPTHFAIALRYDPKRDSAPTVIAKGVDELAQRIKKIATENGIPLHEDRELARSLYKVCNVGDSIPEHLFQAVAKILAYIFQLKRNKKGIV